MLKLVTLEDNYNKTFFAVFAEIVHKMRHVISALHTVCSLAQRHSGSEQQLSGKYNQKSAGVFTGETTGHNPLNKQQQVSTNYSHCGQCCCNVQLHYWEGACQATAKGMHLCRGSINQS